MSKALHVKIEKIWENVQKKKKQRKKLQDIKLAQTKCQNLSMSRLGKFEKMYIGKKNLNKNLQDIKLAQTKCQNLSMSRLGKFGKMYKEK